MTPSDLGAAYSQVLDALLPPGEPKGSHSRARRRAVKEAAKGEPSFAKHFAIASLRPLTAPPVIAAIEAAEMLIFGGTVDPVSPAMVYNARVRRGRNVARTVITGNSFVTTTTGEDF